MFDRRQRIALHSTYNSKMLVYKISTVTKKSNHNNNKYKIKTEKPLKTKNRKTLLVFTHKLQAGSLFSVNTL